MLILFIGQYSTFSWIGIKGGEVVNIKFESRTERLWFLEACKSWHLFYLFIFLFSREAARECRRKKKEYVKCLENRVAVLENQNKTLIEELKALKELYCQKEGWRRWSQ